MKIKDMLNSMELWLFSSVTNKGGIVFEMKQKMKPIKLCPRMKKSSSSPNDSDANTIFRIYTEIERR